MNPLQRVKKTIEDHDRKLVEEGLRIYGRSAVATAYLLTMCSVLRFHFQGRPLVRGWLDVLVLGDTRCGKSAIAEGIVSGTHMGEMFKCENVSYAGLIGGLQQIGQRSKWDIVWGKIPLNSGRACIADEMSSLSIEDIGNMSAVRSSGIAEINKVQSGMTRAATRMFWISNPRDSRSMSEYTYGVQAVQELIGRPEDIARFDFVVGVRSDDVPLSVVNANRNPPEFTPDWEAITNLIRWAWGLRCQDVVFTDEATDACLSIATAQAKEYANNIPLVEPNEQRVRLARVATSVAVRSFSEQGGKLYVRPQHVEYADHFMRECFNGRAMNYNGYSKAMKRELSENAASIAHVKDTLLKFCFNGDMRPLRLLHHSDVLTPTDIEVYFNVPRAEGREIVSTMMRHGCLSRKSAGFVKTQMGIALLEEMLK